MTSNGPSGDILTDSTLTLSDATAIKVGDDSREVPTRFLLITTAGAIKVTTSQSQEIVFPSGALAVNEMHPIRVTHIWATGTTLTAAQIFAFF